MNVKKEKGNQEIDENYCNKKYERNVEKLNKGSIHTCWRKPKIAIHLISDQEILFNPVSKIRARGTYGVTNH